MKDEDGWQSFDEHLLARLTNARWTELDRLRVGDARECVFYNVYRIVLSDSFDVSNQDISVEETGKGKRTKMSSWSDRQFSMVTVSGWLGARTVKRYFPPNMRIRGDLADSAYS